MLNKSLYFLIIILALTFVGCDDQPLSSVSDNTLGNSGRTNLMDNNNSDISKQLAKGNVQNKNQSLVYIDISENPVLSGTRTMGSSPNYDCNQAGNSFGRFTFDSESGQHWEGDWVSRTTASGTTIRATGYNFDDRDQSCEWNYFFPCEDGGKQGTFRANLHTNK